MRFFFTILGNNENIKRLYNMCENMNTEWI